MADVDKKTADLTEVHQEAVERFDLVWDAEQDQRDAALEDIRFAQIPGAQWDKATKEKRSGRPCFEINKIAIHVNQVCGEQRNNRIAINVRPVGGDSDKKLSEIYKGLIKNIENLSSFKDCKDNAFFEVCNGGIGGWYVTTEFSDRDTFDQDIVLKPIRSAASSIFFDPAATMENKQDAEWCFVVTRMTHTAFKKKYPTAILSDMPDVGSSSVWIDTKTVLVADYWVKSMKPKQLCRLVSGEVVEYDPNLEDKLPSPVDTFSDGRKMIKSVKSAVIRHYKISGKEVLSGPNEWAGSHIPVIILYGYNFWIEGKHYFRGMVRMSKDAQKTYNYATSTVIEAAAMTPKDPIWMTAEQAHGYEEELESMAVSNKPVQLYNSDPKAPGTPQRAGAPAVQSALIQQIAQADQDIMATAGRFAPSLGDNPQMQSGKAILAQQRQGDLGTAVLSDNLRKAVEWTGKILVDLIPKIYDTDRQIRILEEDGADKLIRINHKVVDASGKTRLINDVSQGKYDVHVDVGPAYATKRIEALNVLNTLAESNPQFAQIAPDLISKMVDFPYADELSSRFRKILLAQGVVDPNEEEMQNMKPPTPDPSQQIMLQRMLLETEKLAAEIDKMELENKSKEQELKLNAEKTLAEIQKLLADSISTKTDTAIKAAEAGIPIENTPDEAAVWDKNVDLMNEEISNALRSTLVDEIDLSTIDDIAATPEGSAPSEAQAANEIPVTGAPATPVQNLGVEEEI